MFLKNQSSVCNQGLRKRGQGGSTPLNLKVGGLANPSFSVVHIFIGLIYF